MITMTLHPAEPAKPQSGSEFFIATARWYGREFSARTQGGVTMALARDLVAAGCADQAWQAVRAGTVALLGPSLHRLAMFTVSEGDKSPPRFRTFQPYNFAEAA